MKIQIYILIGILSISANVGSQTIDQSVQIKKPEVVIPKQIESFLIKEFGLSSTGTIKAIGKYHLTQNSKLGSEKDEIIHVIQQDLGGSRLFWSCLVNLNQGKVLVLYRSGDADKYGTIMMIKNDNS